MSGETSKRSNLIDVTYHHLHGLLSGRLEGTTADQVSEILRVRVEQLSNIVSPFGKPSDASKKQVESGNVTLRDGITIRVEKADQAVVLAISKKFDIDEVEALILLRSFLYNEGLPPGVGDSSSATSLVDDIVENITSFFYSEQLYALRVFIPLFRAFAGGAEPVASVAAEFLPRFIPDNTAFVQTLMHEFKHKLDATVPQGAGVDPRRASQWAKQNTREQLALLEVLFWSMWDYVTRTGPLVVEIYTLAYDSDLGSAQANAALLLDDEGSQILQDVAAMWMLIMIEILELERLASPEGVQLSEPPKDPEIYWSSPEALEKIHGLVISHPESQFGCAFAGWTFFLSRLWGAAQSAEVPPAYADFVANLINVDMRVYPRETEPAFKTMSRQILAEDSGFFRLLLTLLVNSPLFVTSVAWRTGSNVTDPNAVAYRSVMKGLVIALLELVEVERVPNFEELVEVWVALFGRSEPASVAGICRQFWGMDLAASKQRRALLDVARSRFPIQSRPLIRLLRSLTASGFLDTDPLSTADHGYESEHRAEDRQYCAQNVLHYLHKLPTYTQIIPTSASLGPHALYDKFPERLTSSTVSTGPYVVNTRALKLPGGTTLPLKTTGRLLSGELGDHFIVAWQHEHSGWKLLLEFLTDYVNRRRKASNGSGYQDLTFGRAIGVQPLPLRLDEIGVEMDENGDDWLVTDILDLIRGVVKDHSSIAEQLLVILESGDPVVSHTMTEASPPDLVQLTTMILDDALSRSSPQSRGAPCTQLITSAMSVLAALLPIAKYSNRVWLYIRSTASLFGSEGSVGFSSSVLANERLTGHYTMTLALLHLIHQLFSEASSSVLTVLQDSPRLQQVKEEVLMRAARFMHSEVWVEHVGWKYAQLGDRFEIGRRVSTLYAQILKHAPPDQEDAPFVKLSRAVTEALLFRATPSAVHPLVTALNNSSSVLSVLSANRRYGDARRLIYMLESHLVLMRRLLSYKQRSPAATKLCLLEQALCTRSSTGSSDSESSKMDPVDALSAYVKERRMGSAVPAEAVEVLYALCSSLSACEGTVPTIVGHLSDPEGTVSSLVRIILHPYDDAFLRNSVWNFITLAVDKEPALASLFVTGRFRNPSVKGKEKAGGELNGSTKAISALTVACDMLEQWRDLWDVNPQLLASLLRFLNVVWDHGHEHKAARANACEKADFFAHISSIIKEELGPAPEFRTENLINEDGVQHSDLHEGVAAHAYRTAVKAHAVHIAALDIRMASPTQATTSNTKPASFTTLEELFKSEDDIPELVGEAAAGAYDPSLYDDANALIQTYFPSLSLGHLRRQEPVVAREFGDGFAFSPSLLALRLQPFNGTLEPRTAQMMKNLLSINLNLSLAHAQTTLTESWRMLLLQVVPFLRGNAQCRPIFLSLASTVSAGLAAEKRSGDMMANVHNVRLSLLLSLLENAWFSTTDNAQEVLSFIELVENVKGIIQSAALPPEKSFLGQVSVPFHRPLLQIAYFCVRQARSLASRNKTLNAKQRLTINAMLESLLNLSIDALRLVFDNAQVTLDVDLDQDMQLLVAVFEQATRPELNSSTLLWLTRCQETDVIRTSLQLFTRMDVVGFSDLALLRAKKHPLYAPHVLVFHMALAGIPSAAERLASEGVVAAYAGNAVSKAASSGQLEVVLPELPGEHNPAHYSYCTMLSVIAGVTASLGRHGQFFVADVCGLVQLYSEQIHRALSWTIGDTLTLPLLDEIEQTVALFSAIAMTSRASGEDESVKRVEEMFTADALLLLQQLNYALTHHNHLASLFEPITAEERVAYAADGGNTTASSSASSDMVDLVRRPFLARLVHRLFKISGAIIMALVNISKGEDVLCKDPDEWPGDQAFIVPHSKVVLGEPASLGTLLELGNCSLDLLRRLADRPTGQSVTIATRSIDTPLDVGESITTVRRCFEAVTLYGVTQLAQWLSRPDLEASTADMEVEDSAPGELMMSVDKEREKERDRKNPLRQSMTMGERFRRGLMGEMALDFHTLLLKGKLVIPKTVKAAGAKEVDLTSVLDQFVQERISVQA